MRRTIIVSGLAVLLSMAAMALGLEGLDGTTTSNLLDGTTVQTEIGWSDVEEFQLGVPWGSGGEVAAESSGNVYFLVGGYTPSVIPSDPQPMYTGLVLYDGLGFRLLAEYKQNQGSGPHTGKLMRKLAVSPASAGLLSAGGPVLLLHRTVEVGGNLVYSVDLVMVDPVTTSETLVYRFGTEAADAAIAIDDSGTIYVGPLSDGSIDRLTYSAGTYSASAISTNFYAVEGLVVDAEGNLYTFEQGASWSPTGVDREIIRLEPETGATSSFGWVDGDASIFDWAWSGGKLWIACRGPAPKGKKDRKIFVAEAPASSTAGEETAITQSAHDPSSVAAAPAGKLLVLESPITLADNAIFEVAPGSSGEDDGGKPPKKPRK